MNYIRKRLTNRNFLLLFASDIFIIVFSLYVSFIFRFDFIIPNQVLQYFDITYTFLLVIIKIFFFRIFSLYRGMWRYASVWDMFNIIKATSLSSFSLILIIMLTKGFDITSRSVFFIDYIICTGLVCISRLGIRLFFSHFITALKTKNIPINKKRILILGAGDSAHNIIRQTLQKFSNNISVVGLLDDDKNKIGKKIHGIPVLGKISNLNDLNGSYDEIYICIPSANREQMISIIDECKKTKKVFKTLPSLSELIEGKISISQFREVSIVDLLGREEIELNKKSINKFIQGKRVLVSGAGGSIGSELVRQCIKFQPSLIIMIDISEYNLFQIDRETKSISSKTVFKPILADIRELGSVDKVFNKFEPHVVIHATAYKHVPIQEDFPEEAIKTNIYGTSNIAQISIKYNVKKFVLVSTDKAVKPTNVMGASKRLAEVIIQNFNKKNYKTEFMAVRFGNVLGSSGSVIPIFQEQIKNGGPITITNPNMERYFMSIPEASQLILQAGALGTSGEVFILDMGEPIKIIDIANELIRLSGYEPNRDILIEITGARPGEKKIEELALPTESFDNTKHDKIFVLKDSKLTNEMISKIMIGIKHLNKKMIGKSTEDVKHLISEILPEYEPNNALKDIKKSFKTEKK